MTSELAEILFPNPCMRTLFERSAGSHWTASQVLDWNALSLNRIAPPLRQSLSALYSDALFAESMGVEFARAIADRAPRGFLRAFALEQARDEGVHARFFAKAVEQLGASQSVGPSLEALHDELARIEDVDELMLHLQVVELSAQAVLFTNARRTLQTLALGVRLPGSESLAQLLRGILQNVARDESRHVAFGHRYLRLRFAEMCTERRRSLQRRATVSMRLMYSTFKRHEGLLARVHPSVEAALETPFRGIQEQLERLGISLDDSCFKGD